MNGRRKEKRVEKSNALELLHSKMQSQNLRKHCYSVAAVMRALAKHFKEDEDKWEIVGLLHDGDYEFTKEDPANHAKLMANCSTPLSGFSLMPAALKKSRQVFKASSLGSAVK